MNIQILIYDGFDELDAIGPYEVLRTAAAAGATLETELVTLEATTEITAGHGLRLRPAGRLAFGRRPEVVIVPGGGWVARSPKGARAEAERGAIPAALVELHRSGCLVASVCTGAMLLAAAGLLRGRPATTHQGAIEDLRAAGAVIVRARVVDDEDLITSGGVTSGLDLALWLVERFHGPETAHKLEQAMEYERRGVVWRKSRADQGSAKLPK
jgi:transcriptional regulator GlxA family with amidase domain